MTLEINENNELVFKKNLFDFIQNLPEEEIEKVVSAVTWDKILESAIDRLAGDGDWWSSKDDEYRLDFISRVENRLMASSDWGILSDLKHMAKEVSKHKNLYRAMWSDLKHYEFFRKWLKENGFTESYPGTTFNDTEDFRVYCASQFTKMRKEHKR